MTSPGPSTPVKLGFERQCARLQIADIELRRAITPRVKRSAKYRQILSSVREVGIVEPPQVVPTPAGPLKFLLVAGHLRIEALKDWANPMLFAWLPPMTRLSPPINM